MRIEVAYRTEYRFSTPARRVTQLLRLTPHSFGAQSVIDWRIDLDRDARLRAGSDGFGNLIHMLYIDQAVDSLLLNVTGTVLTADRAGLVEGLEEPLPPLVFLRDTELTRADAGLTRFATELAAEGGNALALLHRLNGALNGRLRFDPGTTGVETNAAAAFGAGQGVCQDFVHIFLAAARACEIPARYVSGHLFRRDGAGDQPAAHAWAEAWVPALGWVGFDPANGVSPDDAYIRVACGLDYLDAAPVSGSRAGGGEERMTVNVEVRATQAGAQSQSQG